MNKPFLLDINLNMKEDKEKVFKELIIDYLIKQIKGEKEF